MPVAEISGLTVTYGKFVALRDFSLQLPEGCVGLLGPNGAGKTTFLRALLGFLDPAAGDGTVLGHSIRTGGLAIRREVGYMPEQDCHFPGMTAVQYVAYAGELSGLPSNQALRRAHEVLEYTGLGEARYRNVETYSTGMKQRIKLAQALVHGPRLLLLDEPTNGLDPRGREEMLDLVRDISQNKGVNCLVCSHLLKDVERTCDSVIVLMSGEIRAQGAISDLKMLQGQPIDVELRESSGAFILAAAEKGLKLLETRNGVLRLQGEGTEEEVAAQVFAAAAAAGTQIRGLTRAERSLEEAFLEAVNA
ncbi:ABC transporter ATP-binding protein [Kamptonema cortianum]|nr:ABC transporter ATP-binding protein [Geitlerinema splendidum]MDK3157698.1 ABC transporter ATP-binding protein [Kamptonema cortianum]